MNHGSQITGANSRQHKNLTAYFWSWAMACWSRDPGGYSSPHRQHGMDRKQGGGRRELPWLKAQRLHPQSLLRHWHQALFSPSLCCHRHCNTNLLLPPSLSSTGNKGWNIKGKEEVVMVSLAQLLCHRYTQHCMYSVATMLSPGILYTAGSWAPLLR